jgi:hypothetical protein
MFRSMPKTAKYWLTAAVLVLAALYLHGTFDRALAPLGLNLHSCLETPLGAIKCGDQKAEFEHEVEAVKRAEAMEYRKLHPTPREEELGPAERRQGERESKESHALIEELESECRHDPSCKGELDSEK